MSPRTIARKSAVLCLLGVALMLPACGDGSPTNQSVEPLFVRVEPAAMTLDAAGRGQLRVMLINGIMPAGATTRWESSNPTVVSVDQNGNIEALAEGEATITSTVTYKNNNGKGNSKVTVAPQEVSRVEITPDVLPLAMGASGQLTFTAYDPAGKPIPGIVPKWSTSAPQFATVDGSGLVTAKNRSGLANITADYGSLSAGAVAAVGGAVPPVVASVDVTPDYTDIAAGDSLLATVVVKDTADNVVQDPLVSWSSSNTKVAQVGANGLIKAVATGSAIITAASGGKSADLSVAVSEPATAVAFVVASPQQDTIRAIGHSKQFTATARDMQGNVVEGTTITWTSLNTSVATVSNDGNVTAKLAGTALVVAAAASCGGCAPDTVTVHVVQEAASVELSPTSLNLEVGGSSKLTATVKDAAGVVIPTAQVAWAASPAGVVSVTPDGAVGGVAAGTSTVTASFSGKSAEATVTVSVSAITEYAELPRTYVDTRMPSGNRVVSVPANGDLQAALNSAERGDIIELQAGATYSGPFSLPAKPGSGWIIIRSSRHADLAEGVRVTPSQAERMPRLVGGVSNSRALRADAGATHWRLVGLEITLADKGLPTLVNTIVELTFGSSHIIIDRSYIHGKAGQSIQRCVIMNNAASAVIDSWLDECHASGFDSQAIVGWKGPGPFKIVNNHLAGAGENIMFGGAAIDDGAVPSDIEIRRNHLYKPLSWRGIWTVKNSFELKMAERVLFEGNVLENNWADGQVGFAVVIKSENHDQITRPAIATRDVTYRNNIIMNSRYGINATGGASSAEETGAGKTSRLLIHNNQLQLTEERALMLQSDLDHVAVLRNSFSGTGRVLLEGTAGRLTFLHNISNDVKGSGISEGTNSFAQWSSYEATGNAFVGRVSVADRYPIGNYFPDAANNAPSSCGFDILQLETATAGVRINR
jgi:uncharacterized protein YjdB